MMSQQGGELNHNDIPAFKESKSTSSISKNTDLEEMNADIKNMEKPVVWPCMVVVANIIPAVQYKDDGGDIGKKLKDEWIKQGYNPTKVDLLGHSGFAVVKFGEEWDDFISLKMFVKDFEVEKHGRKDWYDGKRGKDDKLYYVWIANDEDYYSNGIVGDFLRKNGALKTLSAFEKKVEVNISKIAMELTTKVEETKTRREEMMIEDFDMMIEEFDTMIENYNEDHAMMQENVNEQLKKNLDNEKKMKELGVLEHRKKVDDRMLKLADDQKREKEVFKGKMTEIQKKLDDKQRLELEINRMTGELEVMKHIITDHEDDVEEAKQLRGLNETEQMNLLDNEEKMKELAILEQKKTDDRMLKLDDEQKVLTE